MTIKGWPARPGWFRVTEGCIPTNAEDIRILRSWEAHYDRLGIRTIRIEHGHNGTVALYRGGDETTYKDGEACYSHRVVGTKAQKGT